MRTKIKEKFKKIISILVCVMMVWVTCPVNMLSGAVFAQDDVQTQAIPNEVELLDDGQEISLEGGGGPRIVVVSSLKELQKAIKQANSGEQTLIALTKDITTSNGWFSSPEYSLECEGKSIIITSANPRAPQTITIKSTKSGLLRAKNSNVTLRDINITGTATPDQSYGAMEDIYVHSAIRVEGGSITIGEGVKFSKYSKIDSKQSSDRSRGNFIWCDRGTVNIEGGDFSYCGSHNSSGSVVYCSGGIVNITGGFFHNCRADRGIICSENAIVNITGGNFNKCYARLGGVAFAYGGNVNINAGNFEECQGSAIALDGAKLVMAGGNFVNCGGADGGAVKVCLGSSFIMTGGTISGCYASYGGAIYVSKDSIGFGYSEGASFIMQGGEISGCHSGYGGAIYVGEGCEARLEKGTITGCCVPMNGYSHGSAIYACYTSKISIAKKESGLFQILNLQSGHNVDTYPSLCGGYGGIYLCERPADIEGEGRRYIEVKELAPPLPENNDMRNGGFVSSGEVKSNSQGAGEQYDWDSDTRISGSEDFSGDSESGRKYENYDEDDEDEDDQYYEDDTGIFTKSVSDNDLYVYGALAAFLDEDPGSEITQIDFDSGIVLTAKDEIIPAGYHLFVKKVQKDSDEWKQRIKDIDSRYLNNIEKMGMYDISIQNSSGDIFTLPKDSTVTVFMPCPDGYDENDLQILHISSGVDEEFDEEITTVYEKKYCKFKTNHFSPYAIIDEISKNDLFEMMAPWLIGAAVVAIGAAVVVFVLKNKGANRV